MVSPLRSLTLAAAATVALLSASADAKTSCTATPSSPGDRRGDKTQLKYATYNAEFLFLQGYGTLKCPGENCKWKAATDAQNHVKEVAAILKKINANMVQLDEVEDCAALDAVIEQLQQLGDATYKPYIVDGDDSYTGQNVGFLTRVDPIATVQRTAASVKTLASNSTCPSASGYAKSKGVSKNIYATFKPTGFSKPLTVIGAHFLARLDDKKHCFEREAPQATVTASLATSEVSAGNHVIISGDFNDWSRAAPDRNANKPISNTLGIMRARDSSTSEWYDKNNDCVYALTETSSLDHIIVSKSLKANVKEVAFRNDLYTASCTGYDSDHFPVTATFTAV